MLKAAVVTGVCVERDAISAAAVDQAAMLATFAEIDDVVLIAHAHGRACDFPTLAAGDSWELLRALDRLGVDLVIFHWGIVYDLFNALPIVARDHRAAVHFHNVTPAELMPPERRRQIEHSIRQMQLPAFADVPVWAVSAYNRETLVHWGYAADQVREVPIVGVRPKPARAPLRLGGPVRLLTVGRLISAKGVDVLVDAMRTVADRLEHDVSLVLAGSSHFSDQEFVDSLRARIERYRLGESVTIKQDLDDAALDAEYARADILVAPSLHEGLCVPVIEAYHAGLRVVASDAGNLPFVVQHPDPVVPAGDASALAGAIIAVAGEVLAGTSATPPGAAELVRKYSPDGVRAEFVAAVRALGIPLDSSSTPSPTRSRR